MEGMEGAGQEGWGLEGLLGSLSCSGATGLVELGLPGWGGGLIPACRGVDFCPPPISWKQINSQGKWKR